MKTAVSRNYKPTDALSASCFMEEPLSTEK